MVTGSMPKMDRDSIFDDVVEILKLINADWEIGEVVRHTPLGSVVPESISLVYLIGDLQHNYHLQDRLVQKLRTVDKKLTDLNVGELVDFVYELLNDPERAQGGTVV